jgi:hypothetical protein
MANDNIIATGQRIWAAVDPNFLVDDSSPLIEAGLDLSQPFMLDGELIGPLPGMVPGYFNGAAPTLGATQYVPEPTMQLFFLSGLVLLLRRRSA